jgi:hypothetical protein
MSDVKKAVLETVKAKPMRARELRMELTTKRGFKPDDVRSAVAQLWDTGKVNVGVDQVIRPTES